MTVSLTSLQKLMSLNLSTEQMAGVMEVLAVELAPLEAIRRSSRERQKRYAQREANVMAEREDGGKLTSASSRVEDNNKTTTLVDRSRKTFPPNPPLPSKPDEPEGFAEFWDAYPKRDGSADRKGAVKAFRAALRRASLTTILDGAGHFCEAMTARNKVGTEFIPQARTWLNSDRWSERYETATVADSRHAQNLAILEKYRAAPRS